MRGQRIGLVLAGGGARGAYEAGALSVLLPTLQARGERPTVLVGTSVGAINAAYLAGSAHLDAAEATAGLLRHWRETTVDQVMRPLRAQLPLLGARMIGSLLAVPGARVSSLLDPTPNTTNLKRRNDWAALRDNIDRGCLHAVAAIATEARTERTVVFCDSGAGVPGHRSHALDYVATELTVDHVRASAAIPLLFPPVRIEHPTAARGWYVDGGVRLGTPIKPALDLGVDRLVVVGTGAIADHTPAPDHPDDPPGLGDSALNVLHGRLVDPLVEDLRTLGNVNTFFADHAPRAQRYREARGKTPYREIPYIFVGPRRPGRLGELAAQVFRARYRGPGALRSPSLALLGRLLGAGSTTHNELFSYLFFDRAFVDELITAGAQDARDWLQAPPGPAQPWQVEPLDAFATPAGNEARPTQ